jgi:hypothetical protein
LQQGSLDTVPSVAPSASVALDPKAPVSKVLPSHLGANLPPRPADSQNSSKSRVEQRGLAKDNPFK